MARSGSRSSGSSIRRRKIVMVLEVIVLVVVVVHIVDVIADVQVEVQAAPQVVVLVVEVLELSKGSVKSHTPI